MAPYQSPYNQGDKLQKGLSKVAAAIVPGERETQKREADRQARAQCVASGGRWDEATGTCIMPPPKVENSAQGAPVPQAQLTSPEVYTNQSGRPSGIALPDGRSFLGLSQDDVNKIAQREQAKTQLPEGTAPVGTAQAQLEAGLQGQALAGQVGQFGQLPVSPTGFDTQEAVLQGIAGTIPRALSLATAGAGAGLVGGATVGSVIPGAGTAAGAGAGAAIGAAAGFVSGISSGIISNYKKQRTDTTQQQRKVLREGKQNLKDWATLAQADPSNKAYYLSQYNAQAAQIDKAYRQLKLDTSRDLAKFEGAEVELTEFEMFYGAGGEKDAIDQDMRNALMAVSSPEYRLLELANRGTNELQD